MGVDRRRCSPTAQMRFSALSPLNVICFEWIQTKDADQEPNQAAVLIASPDSQLLARFYTYLTQEHPEFKTEEQQKRLQLRLRDTLLKLVTLVGAPQVLCALSPLAKAEGKVEEKAQASTLNPKWLVLRPVVHIST